MPTKKKEEEVIMHLRIPVALHKKLSESAKSNLRTRQKEVNFLLAKALEKP